MSVQVNEFDPAFSALVSERLESIEARLLDAARADTPFVTEAASHIISAGGKRFRPLLVVLASQLLPGAASDRIDRAAIVMELTHVASLYHDDVMDEAAVRRSVDSANARWDNTVAILVGDYLFTGRPRCDPGHRLRGPCRPDVRAWYGQIAETRGPLRGRSPAALPRRRGRQDGLGRRPHDSVAWSAASDEILDALGRYGEQIGVVFGCRDMVASDTSGKTPGTDLRERPDAADADWRRPEPVMPVCATWCRVH